MAEQLDQPLSRSRSQWMRWFHPARASRSDGFGRFAEATARFMGSPKFVLYMTVFVAAWIAANVLLVRINAGAWDPYPFILLNLAFSTQASYSAPLILLAQNRQDDRDRVTAEQDRQRAQRNLEDTEFLTREIASLRLAMNDVATRDFVRSELRNMLEELLTEERRSREEIVGEIVEELSEEDDDGSGPPARAAEGAPGRPAGATAQDAG